MTYLLYGSADDCNSALGAVMISGDCVLKSNCTYGSIYAEQEDGGTVCSLTTFGKLNEVSGQDYGYMVFYFDTPENANASFSRIAWDGDAKLTAPDEFQMHANTYGNRVSVPYVTGLINISIKD
eukprot:CAMPEP_0201579054 /NCGR_PEP_ID=MMETSP0190_2-20130828/26299_1 /ASSEMBLY_ACC=CAM_ASM_000263 /TAXON_ID=37353 /ORGANISM="Rosalina sp." /LENGTH=123 /DNA_ID=CAMNT_0048012945 /DNA_START=143 /DNA_END=514 /DNA_ORIENTATION=-